MRARTLNGYWVFAAPVGYRYQRTPGHGNLLVRDEPIASIIAEALEGYASGRLDTQVEVKRFLEAQTAYPKDLPGGEIRNQRIYELMTRVLFAGYIEVSNWNVSLRKGHHDALISYETYLKIQERLNGGKKAPARADIAEDFPLRGFVICGDCERPMTSCWSKSKTGKRHPYYMCFRKGCPPTASRSLATVSKESLKACSESYSRVAACSTSHVRCSGLSGMSDWPRPLRMHPQSSGSSRRSKSSPNSSSTGSWTQTRL